jgi:hypothetical protein
MLSQRSFNQTGARQHVLMDVGLKLCAAPPDFDLHPVIRKLLASRRQIVESKQGKELCVALAVIFNEYMLR